jgi:AcrR family transcriptional regulator
MAGRKGPLFERQGYHHGNLKEALVAAARSLIAERGPAGFTLAEAARIAGVSPAAPYRHFKDRDGLIAEVAQRGFVEFGRRLAAAWGVPENDARAGFARMGEAYLAFAREEPGYYGAMFASGGAPGRVRQSGDTAFGSLEQAIARLTAQTGVGRQRVFDSRLLAHQVWAISHGIATLSAAGYLPKEGALRPDALLRSGVGALIAGSTIAAPSDVAAEAKSEEKPRRRRPRRALAHS